MNQRRGTMIKKEYVGDWDEIINPKEGGLRGF